MEVNQTKQKQDQKTMTDRGLTAEPQAGALKGEIERTELGEEENPFLRRSKVAHTPPKREGSLDRPRKDLRMRHGSLDLSFATQDAEVDDSITLESSPDDFVPGKRKKKNRQESEEKAAEGSQKSEDENLSKKGKNDLSDNVKKNEANLEPSSTMMKLSKKVNELVTFGRENSNVHKRVKALANEISSFVRMITVEARHDKTRMMELETEIAGHRQAKMALEKKLLESENLEERNTCTRSTQTGKFDLRCKRIETYEDFLVVQDDEWEEECFKMTTVESGNPLKKNIENVVYFCDEDDKQERWYKQIKSRYPEFEEVPRTKCEGGSCITLEQTVKYGVGTDARKKIKNTIVLFHDPSKQSESDQTDVYNLITTARTMCSDMDMGKIGITLPQGLKTDRMRKMTEAVFHDTNTQVTIYKPANAERGNVIQKKVYNGEAILIEGEGTTYAETLKTLREKMVDKETLKEIKGVRKTLKGGALLTLKEGGTRKLKSTLEEILQNRRIITMKEGKDVTIHLRGLDSMTTKEEVKESVIATGLIKRKERLLVKALRPAYGESQTATITAIEEDARRIIKEGTVRVGLSLCAAQERLDLEKCYRCWGYGHKARDCEEEDRSESCRKCAKTGHVKKHCIELAYCPLCQKTGHEAGEGRCTIFRNALAAARRRSPFAPKNEEVAGISGARQE
jgi:hypothetical protein